MKLDGRLMGFLADLQDQSKGERVAIERNRLVFAAEDKQVRYLVVPFWWFDKPDKHYLFEIENAHRGGGSRKLPFTAVDKYKLRKRFLFLDHPAIASMHGLVHRCEVV